MFLSPWRKLFLLILFLSISLIVTTAVGRTRAYRFVGTTLANNPFPILIPCHRVIRSDGSFGRFGGGSDLKRKLIELEAG